MCQETFRTPALWVRHIQTHELGSITDLPKRKRRKTTVRVLYLFYILWAGQVTQFIVTDYKLLDSFMLRTLEQLESIFLGGYRILSTAQIRRVIAPTPPH